MPRFRETETLEFGGPIAELPTSFTDGTLVIASYNIRYARGARLISGGVLRKLGFPSSKMRSRVVTTNIQKAARVFADGKLLPRAHVIALQEADKRTSRAGKVHVARELADELKMSWVHAPAGIPRGVKPLKRQWWLDFEEPIDLDDPGDTGIALLSSLPLENVARIDLPWHECPWRPRLAMSADIRFGDRELRLLNVHVDPHAAAGGQIEQLKTIMKHADSTSLPALIVGDFNTLSDTKCKETRSFLEANHFSTPIPTGTPTWRGAGIRLHADWIFSRGVVIKRWGVVKPLAVSDHWPIWAEVTV